MVLSFPLAIGHFPKTPCLVRLGTPSLREGMLNYFLYTATPVFQMYFVSLTVPCALQARASPHAQTLSQTPPHQSASPTRESAANPAHCYHTGHQAKDTAPQHPSCSVRVYPNCPHSHLQAHNTPRHSRLRAQCPSRRPWLWQPQACHTPALQPRQCQSLQLAEIPTTAPCTSRRPRSLPICAQETEPSLPSVLHPRLQLALHSHEVPSPAREALPLGSPSQ